MQPDHELLAAIRAAPADDAPRLVYADALMERAVDTHARGELIAVQCEVARRESVNDASDAYVRLVLREQEIFARNGAAWAREMGIQGLELSFRRGFLAALKGPLKDVLPATDRLGTSPLLALAIHDVKRTEVARLLAGSVIGCAGALSLVSARRSQESITARNLEELGECPGLAKVSALRIYADKFPWHGMHPIVTSPRLKHLRSIRVGGDVGDRALKAVEGKWSPALRELGFTYPRLSTTGWGILTTDPSLARLETLDLGLHQTNDDAALAVAGSPQLKSLTALRMSHAGPRGLQALVRSPNLRGVRLLALAHLRLDVPTMAALIEGLPALEELLVRNADLAPGVLDLLATKGPRTLRRLVISINTHNGAGDIRALVTSNRFALTDLRFERGGEIGEDGVAAIAQAPAMATLTALQLSDAMTARTAALLASSPHLAPGLRVHFAPDERAADAPPPSPQDRLAFARERARLVGRFPLLGLGLPSNDETTYDAATWRRFHG